MRMAALPYQVEIGDIAIPLLKRRKFEPSALHTLVAVAERLASS